jgi:hypothetical protein
MKKGWKKSAKRERKREKKPYAGSGILMGELTNTPQ